MPDKFPSRRRRGPVEFHLHRIKITKINTYSPWLTCRFVVKKKKWLHRIALFQSTNQIPLPWMFTWISSTVLKKKNPQSVFSLHGRTLESTICITIKSTVSRSSNHMLRSDNCIMCGNGNRTGKGEGDGNGIEQWVVAELLMEKNYFRFYLQF